MTDVALVAFYRVRETWMNPADRDLRRRAGVWNPEVYRVPRTTALATSKESQQGATQASKKKDECVGFLSL